MSQYRQVKGSDLIDPMGNGWDFPELVDNTMRCDYVKCESSFFFRHILCRTGETTSIHLVAGGAFAAGNDAYRKARYGEGKSHEDSLAAGFIALTQHYGYDDNLENNERWADSNKSWLRMVQAYLEYWKQYSSPLQSKKKPLILEDGTVASELSFELELDVLHPRTGKPLIYHGRCDVIEDWDGALWLVDDKTTGSLGESWAKQWGLRSQFMGYTYGFRKAGYNVVGAIARGTGILKTKITHMEVPNTYPPALLDKWWAQVNFDFASAVDAFKLGKFNYNFSEGCTQFGGCDFNTACRSKFENRALNMMPMRKWNPKDPESSVLIFP